jgi:hypothetical protein
MDEHYSPPALSADPTVELAQLIQRSLELQEEGLTVSRRMRELHEQIAQRLDAARNEDSGELRAQGNR